MTPNSVYANAVMLQGVVENHDDVGNGIPGDVVLTQYGGSTLLMKRIKK